MNQTKSFRVEIAQQKSNFAILEMPKEYRKGYTAIKKNEIAIEKAEAQIPKKKDAEQTGVKDYYVQRKRNILIIKDEREKATYQSQKFIDDLPQATSLVLFKNKDRYTLHFINQKSEVYKYMTEAEQNIKFRDIDKGLDARKNQENRDRVEQKPKKQVIAQVPEYEENGSSSDIDEIQAKKKQQKKNAKKKDEYKLTYPSDDEGKAKKKVKPNDSSDGQSSSDSIADSYDS